MNYIEGNLSRTRNDIFMAYSGNPNTKYGRRKNRNEFWNRYHNEMTDDERRENDNNSGCMMLVIIVIVVILAFVFLGPEKALKYLSK